MIIKNVFLTAAFSERTTKHMKNNKEVLKKLWKTNVKQAASPTNINFHLDLMRRRGRNADKLTFS